MEYYRVISDFDTTSSTLAFFQAIASAVPPLFSVILFVFWLLGTATSYFVILKTTGKKRFFQTLTAMSFVMFLASLLMASLNTVDVVVLNGYWIIFYIMMTGLSWLGLRQYK